MRLNPLIFSQLFFSLLAPLLLSARLSNTIRPRPTGAAAEEGRALIVYGVALESVWDFPQFGVNLDEYDLKTQAITGNCARFNRTEASIPAKSEAKSGTIAYFAFDAAPGYYVYSPFNGASLKQQTQAFVVAAGSISYIGDFIYAGNKIVQLRRDLDVQKSAIANALPGLPGGIVLAQTVAVTPPHIFLCAP